MPKRSEKQGVAGRSVVIPAQQTAGLVLEVEGLTPLICHRFGDKARIQLREAHEKAATKAKKAPRGPEEIASEIMACHYLVAGNESAKPTEGRFGFPSSGFKSAAVAAAPFGTGLFKSRAKSMFFVVGEVVPILCDRIEPREDAVRLENGVVQLRYRPYYLGWKARFGIQYSPETMTPEQITNLFDLAGTMVGIGERRPGKTGETYGQWKITGLDSCAVADLPKFMLAPEANTLLERATLVAQKLGAVS